MHPEIMNRDIERSEQQGSSTRSKKMVYKASLRRTKSDQKKKNETSEEENGESCTENGELITFKKHINTGRENPHKSATWIQTFEKKSQKIRK